VTVYEPTGRFDDVELVIVTVDVPGLLQAFTAEVLVTATGGVRTVIVAVLFEARVLEQEPPCATIAVTVIVELPPVVKPVAVNVPVPAVLTVMVAVLPVCDGEEVL